MFFSRYDIIKMVKIMRVIDMPKIVLHLHLDGSLLLSDMVSWMRELGIHKSEEELQEFVMVDDDCHSLNDYLTKFDLPCSLLQTKEHLRDATYHLFLRLSALNVVYAEVRFAPAKHLNWGLNLDEVVTSVIEGMNAAIEATGIMGGIILSLMRGDSEKINLEVVDIAKKYLGKGVCGIDLAGAEAIYPTQDYKDIFKYAKDLSIPFTIHAGEAAGVSSINAALLMGAKRIGHGIRAIDDEELQGRLIKDNILLEICVTSNYQTEAIKMRHPIDKLYEKGIKISINTDNDTVSNIDINKEYEKIIKENLLSIEEILECNINSIPFIFASNTIKDKLNDIFQEYKDTNLIYPKSNQ